MRQCKGYPYSAWGVGWGGGAESARADFNFKNFRDIYAIPTECGHFY